MLREAYYDVVCVGGGGAGVVAAVTAAQAGAHVALISKEPVGYGDTRISDGLMVRPGLVPGDGREALLADLLVGGGYLNQRDLAEAVVAESEQAAAVAEDFGVLFARDREGRLGPPAVWHSGGHAYPRTIYCPPAAGLAFGQALRGALARAKIEIYEEYLVWRLLGAGGRVQGVEARNWLTGERIVLRAGAVILASGGAGWLYYPHTDCVRCTIGDGMALAYAAGAELVDMEMVQFIPFAVVHPPAFCGILIGDPSVAGPGGVLLDGHSQVLLEKVHRHTRAAVTRVMAEAIADGRTSPNGGLFLDMSGNLKTEEGRAHLASLKRRGRLDAVRHAYGQNAYRAQEPWEVLPSAHYTMGGIRVDAWGATAVPGLFAAGQVAGGVHGANRLGSVSLAELFVFGRRAGLAAAGFARNNPPGEAELAWSVWNGGGFSGAVGGGTGDREEKKGGAALAVSRRLQQLMWQKVGIIRDQAGLERALVELDELEAEAARGDGAAQLAAHLWREAAELHFMLTVARAIILGALARRESRGAHYRRDYPTQDNANWRRRTVIRCKNGEMHLDIVEVG